MRSDYNNVQKIEETAMIKYAKSLGRINEEKYDGCFKGRGL
jgi:hypothetical protein